MLLYHDKTTLDRCKDTTFLVTSYKFSVIQFIIADNDPQQLLLNSPLLV
jgi:hypothetical protein